MAARRPPRRADRGQRGFTMFELLITLVVSAVGMAGVLALQLATVRTNASAAQAAEAIAIAEQTVEEARGLTLAQMYTEYEDDGALPIDHDFGGATVLGRTTTYTRRVIVEEMTPSPDLMRIRVEVYWAEDGADVTDDAQRRTVSLEVLRTRQETL